jgi:D-ribose pyranose/furanose isomerase RbsD
MKQATDTNLREIKELIQQLDKKMDLGFAELKGEIKQVEVQLKAEIKQVEVKLEGEIKQVEVQLKAEIKQVEAKLEGEIKTVNARLTGLESNTQKIPDLAEKVGELKNWKQIAIIVITGTVSSAIAWFVRGGKML